MGHTIQHYDYPGNADKKKVEQELANYVAKRMWTDTNYSFSYRSIRIPTFVQKLSALLKNISMSTLVEKT